MISAAARHAGFCYEHRWHAYPQPKGGKTFDGLPAANYRSKTPERISKRNAKGQAANPDLAKAPIPISLHRFT